MKEDKGNSHLIKFESSILKRVNNQLDITEKLTKRLESSKLLNPLIIEGTPSSPSVRFDAKQGIIELKGNWTLKPESNPMTSSEFCKPLLDWLDQYKENPRNPTNGKFQFEYIGTSGSHCMLYIFKIIERLYMDKIQVLINWFYKEGDNEILEMGEDFASLIRAPFKMIPYKFGEEI